MKHSFQQNWKLYLMEAFGLAIFMISACFFGGILESRSSIVHHAIESGFIRNIIMGIMMGLTALFIFYSPWTSPSGSHINPAVTLSLLRIGKMNRFDAFFYIVFQFIGGTIAVYIMQWLMGDTLTNQPVNSVVTIPGKTGVAAAFMMEFAIAFIMMTMVLFTSANEQLKRYTRIIAGCLVCLYVIVAGPVSGFGMNPARSFASALPTHTWTACWIYMIVPVIGMMAAVEFFLLIQKKKKINKNNMDESMYSPKKKILESFEFVL
ncbi:MAG: aquaporin [Ferruginibacter sp.]